MYIARFRGTTETLVISTSNFVEAYTIALQHWKEKILYKISPKCSLDEEGKELVYLPSFTSVDDLIEFSELEQVSYSSKNMVVNCYKTK